MRVSISLAVFALLMPLVAAAQAPKGKADSKTLRFRMNPFHSNVGKVEAVKPDGTVAVRDLANPRFTFSRNVANKTDLTEGLYLGIIAEDFLLSTKDAKVLRVQVTNVGEGGSATLRVGPKAAGKIEPGEDIILFRPPGSTTAQLKAAPDFAPVEDNSGTSVRGGSSRLGVRDRARLVQSQNNLKQIAIAIHNFHDVHNGMPPAYLTDAKGKPTLSWRVLLLPYLEQQALYERFKFDEPWDSPHNKKLLDRMPDVYRDPIHGGERDHFTHYAAIVGKNAAFLNAGVQVTDAKRPLANYGRGDARRTFGAFTDGLSNTIMIGSMSPDQKIPWTKPEDVELTDKFPAMGKKGSFATPYRTATAAAGVFAFGDAHVQAIRSDIDINDWRNLMRINDSNVIGEIPTLGDRRRPKRSTAKLQVIEIIRGKDGVKARFLDRVEESSQR